MPKITLDALFDEVVEMDARHPPDPSEALACLQMAGCRRAQKAGEPIAERALVALAVGRGPNIATAARLMILTCDPVAAVLKLPAYGASLPVGKTLADYGAGSVSELPPDLRRDALVYMGEDERNARRCEFHIWDPEVCTWRKQDGTVPVESIFDDLFLLDKMTDKALLGGTAAGLLNRRTPRHEVRELVRKQLFEILGRGLVPPDRGN